MDLGSFRFLQTARAQRWLERLAENPITPKNHLAVASQLRKEMTSEEAHALLETALLRQRAVEKFGRATEMYFTREALEQASSEVVSRHRAARYRARGFRRVADLGCSVGGDALSLAAEARVVGIERDPVRLAMACENVAVYGHARRFWPLQADLLALPPLPLDALFFDPARRDERGRRFFSVRDYRPPLTLLEKWLPTVPHAGVKISPGVDYAELPPEAEVEFVSLAGDVKEAVLWFGDLRSGPRRRATLLPGGHTLTSAERKDAPVITGRPGPFLYEPDGAVVRAHLVETLAQELDAHKVDDDIAYLAADRAQPTPFARCFIVDDALPFQLKRLRQRLRQMNVGRLTIKKRGSPLEPEELRRRLRLEGEGEAIIFLTHVQGEPYVLIGREWPT